MCQCNDNVWLWSLNMCANVMIMYADLTVESLTPFNKPALTCALTSNTTGKTDTGCNDPFLFLLNSPQAQIQKQNR